MSGASRRRTGPPSPTRNPASFLGNSEFSMGARGRRKKLPSIEKMDGSPGKRRKAVFNEAIAVDALGEPFVPEHLDDDARGCIEVIRQSMPLRVYSALEVSNPDFRWLVVNGSGSEAPSPRIGRDTQFLELSKGHRLLSWDAAAACPSG